MNSSNRGTCRGGGGFAPPILLLCRVVQQEWNIRWPKSARLNFRNLGFVLLFLENLRDFSKCLNLSWHFQHFKMIPSITSRVPDREPNREHSSQRGNNDLERFNFHYFSLLRAGFPIGNPIGNPTGTQLSARGNNDLERFNFHYFSCRLRRSRKLERFLEKVPVFVFYWNPDRDPNWNPASLQIG